MVLTQAFCECNFLYVRALVRPREIFYDGICAVEWMNHHLAVDMLGLLQAEEAQKLRLQRKRMKAESLRLLDMERRQKQRVEEIREVQKQVCKILTFILPEITNYCLLFTFFCLSFDII